MDEFRADLVAERVRAQAADDRARAELSVATDVMERAMLEAADLPPLAAPVLPDMGGVPGAASLRLRELKRLEAVEARQRIDGELIEISVQRLPQARRDADLARADLARCQRALAAPAAAAEATAAATVAAEDAKVAAAKAEQQVATAFKAAGGDPAKGMGPLNGMLREVAARFYALREQVAAAELAELERRQAGERAVAAAQAAERAKAAESEAETAAARARTELAEAKARLAAATKTIADLDDRTAELRDKLADPALSEAERGY